MGTDGDGFCFGPTARLRHRSEFLAVQDAGKRRTTEHFIVYTCAGTTSGARIGITASRRVGNSIVRSRWKRIVREAFRHLRPDLGVIDAVVICRSGCEPPGFEDALRELEGVLGRPPGDSPG